MATKNPIEFLKEARTELEKVTWPTRKEAVRLTTVVISVSVLVGVFIGVADFIFTKLMGLIVQK
ncbi:preprotein translocase subunit SecE [Candidatus Shapirobacteria bacterium]|nr:preprotein translocase subunit SecE [Candidatus Shapirobacteria bacterium]